LASLYRLTLGFALAVGIGVPLGLLIGSSRRLVESLEFLIDFFRSLPASALFPMFILFFGIGDRSKVAVIVFSCALIILVNAIYGVKNCKEARLRAARAMGANRTALFTKVIFPEALPHIFAGLRISVSIGLILVVVTEMFIGTHRGLGQRIYDAHLMFRIAEMYAVILLTGVLGYVLNKIFITIEAKVFHWAGR
jgi:NitT/TauT family transport system permease protein